MHLSRFVVLLLPLTVGCQEGDRKAPSKGDAPASTAPEQEPSQPKPAKVAVKSAGSPGGYAVPERSTKEVHRGLRAACETGKEKGTPLLIEFSASWCGDCRKLAEMKEEAALKKQLAETPHYIVNIGQFDRHEGLLRDFGIRAIANWQVVGTSDCSAPPSEWKRIDHRTLEPGSGKKEITSAELVEWLQERFRPS